MMLLGYRDYGTDDGYPRECIYVDIDKEDIDVIQADTDSRNWISSAHYVAFDKKTKTPLFAWSVSYDQKGFTYWTAVLWTIGPQVIVETEEGELIDCHDVPPEFREYRIMDGTI